MMHLRTNLYNLCLLSTLYQTAESYFYMPDLGQVPEIDVPSYLPDLPGIADDLSYSADLGPGFAPSGPTHNIPELPSFSEGSSIDGTNKPSLILTFSLYFIKCWLADVIFLS